MGAEENKPKFKTVAQAVRAGLLVDKIYDRLTLPPVNMKFPNEVTEMLKVGWYLEMCNFEIKITHISIAICINKFFRNYSNRLF